MSDYTIVNPILPTIVFVTLVLITIRLAEIYPLSWWVVFGPVLIALVGFAGLLILVSFVSTIWLNCELGELEDDE